MNIGSIESTKADRDTKVLSTGIDGFDVLLGGGLPINHLYLIQGLAGSGKTTLACQIGFSHARLGRKVLVLTLIAESHAKMVQHLGSFRFFDASLVGKEILFHSGYNSISQGGLDELLKFIASSLHEHQPEILIVDGFRTVRESRPSDVSLSEFMHSLNVLVATMGCTTFLLSPVAGNITEAENTLVDGLIELSQYEDGVRSIRELKVFKARGSKHLLGKHVFEIAEKGIVVYPRLEAVVTRTNAAPGASSKRIRFGIPSLDKLTGGGVLNGSSTNLVGHPGIGKTLTGLHFLHQGLREKEKCLMLGFYESPQRIVQKAANAGLNLAASLEDGSLEILWQLPLEQLMDSLANRVLENIERRGVNRLFIDGVESFKHIAVHPERIRPFLIALVNELRARDVTTFFTQELPYFSESLNRSDSTESDLYENIMLLKYVEINGVNHRQISVMKLRETDYDPANRVMRISGAGVFVDGLVSDLVTPDVQLGGER